MPKQLPESAQSTSASTISIAQRGGRYMVTNSGGPFNGRITDTTPSGVAVSVVTATHMLLGGDQIELTVVINNGISVELTDIAAIVAHHGRGTPASLSVQIQIGQDSSLVWRAKPLIVCDGAHITYSTTFLLDNGAHICASEQVVLGRYGERGGTLTTRAEVHRGNTPIMREQATFSGTGDDIMQRFVRGNHRIIGTCVCTQPDHDSGLCVVPDVDNVLMLHDGSRLAKMFS